MMEKRISRRVLLQMSMGLAGAAALAACAPKVVKETVVVEVEKVVTKEVEKIVKETVMVAGTPKVVEKVVKETVVVEKGKDIFQGDLILWQPWGTGYEGGAWPFVAQTKDFPDLHPGVKMTHVWDSTRDKYLAAMVLEDGPRSVLLARRDLCHHPPSGRPRHVL